MGCSFWPGKTKNSPTSVSPITRLPSASTFAINLSFSNLLEFLKSTPIILNLNLAHNKVTDNALVNIEKYILFALNPPLE
jgi:hypothetical protein